jgi:K+ transporter
VQEFDFGRTMFLALQTLAVVFGDIGIGPLYTFDVMFNKYPIHGEEDVLGALSLVLYTLILMPLVKYVLVVLWANDDGEGIFEVVNSFNHVKLLYKIVLEAYISH